MQRIFAISKRAKHFVAIGSLITVFWGSFYLYYSGILFLNHETAKWEPLFFERDINKTEEESFTPFEMSEDQIATQPGLHSLDEENYDPTFEWVNGVATTMNRHRHLRLIPKGALEGEIGIERVFGVNITECENKKSAKFATLCGAQKEMFFNASEKLHRESIHEDRDWWNSNYLIATRDIYKSYSIYHFKNFCVVSRVKNSPNEMGRFIFDENRFFYDGEGAKSTFVDLPMNVKGLQIYEKAFLAVTKHGDKFQHFIPDVLPLISPLLSCLRKRKDIKVLVNTFGKHTEKKYYRSPVPAGPRDEPITFGYARLMGLNNVAPMHLEVPVCAQDLYVPVLEDTFNWHPRPAALIKNLVHLLPAMDLPAQFTEKKDCNMRKIYELDDRFSEYSDILKKNERALKSNKPLVIYTSRGKDVEYPKRQVLNEPEVIFTIERWIHEKAPFLELYQWLNLEYSPMETACIWSKCKLSIGPHGAGLANIIFAQKPWSTGMIEFVTKNPFSTSWLDLANGIGLKYWQILSEGDSNHRSLITVELKLLKDILYNRCL